MRKLGLTAAILFGIVLLGLFVYGVYESIVYVETTIQAGLATMQMPQ